MIDVSEVSETETTSLFDPRETADLLASTPDELSLGALPDDVIDFFFLNETGEYCVSTDLRDQLRLSVRLGENQTSHLIIDEVNGTYTLRDSAYPSASSVGELILKLRDSQINVLGGILGSAVQLGRMVTRHTLEASSILLGDTVRSKRLLRTEGVFRVYSAVVDMNGQERAVLLKELTREDYASRQEMFRMLVSSTFAEHWDLAVVGGMGLLLNKPMALIYPAVDTVPVKKFLSGASLKTRVDMCARVANVVCDLREKGITCGNPQLSDFVVDGEGRVLMENIARLSPSRTAPHTPEDGIAIDCAPEVKYTRKMTEQTEVWALGALIDEAMGNEQLKVVDEVVEACRRDDPKNRPTANGVFMRLKKIAASSL